MQTIRFILVDDHRVVRTGIRAMLIGQPHIELIGEATQAEELFELLEQQQPDIVVMDIRMPGRMSGIDATRLLREKYPQIKVLMLTGNSMKDYLIPAFQAGARGFLDKDCSKETFLEALQKIHRGQDFFDEEASGILFRHFQQNGDSASGSQKELSEREVEVIRAFAEGKSYKEIGDLLYISPRTVETHKKNILQKLGLQTSADLIRYAIRHNITDL
jgi:DNA-binding NarL/FixJ family response regulator